MPTMVRKQPSPALRNRFLAKLPEADFLRLLPLLEPLNLKVNDVVYEFRGPINHVYFSTGAVFSALTLMEDGSAIEVATVGIEGLIGHSAAQGSPISPNKLIVQIAGTGCRIGVNALREEIAWSAPLRDLVSGYHAAFLTQVSQSVACNGLHRLEQRCCRWLLMSRDRVQSDDIQLTHEFLAIMLGARRASVTDLLKPLQQADLIRSHRGMIRIIDGEGLEARTCECYRVVKDEYDRLLG